jgi:hypothetical protein
MSVLGPMVTCHKCGARVSIEGDGKLPVHNVKGTQITCIGSREKARG